MIPNCIVKEMACLDRETFDIGVVKFKGASSKATGIPLKAVKGFLRKASHTLENGKRNVN
jgi:hypothetical protein